MRPVDLREEALPVAAHEPEDSPESICFVGGEIKGAFNVSSEGRGASSGGQPAGGCAQWGEWTASGAASQRLVGAAGEDELPPLVANSLAQAVEAGPAGQGQGLRPKRWTAWLDRGAQLSMKVTKNPEIYYTTTW